MFIYCIYIDTHTNIYCPYVFLFRGNVVSHCVKWASHFSFPCKLSASPSTGILETSLCRVSVRKVGANIILPINHY